MKTIDLHGIKHDEATRIITEACTQIETPFIVITGKSDQMKKVVASTAAQFDLKTRDAINNPGRVIIDEKTLDK